MKKLVLLVVLLATPSFGAWSLVASNLKQSTTGNNVTTDAINSTGANFCLAAVVYYGGGSFTSFADSKSNMYTALTEYDPMSGNLGRVRFYYVFSPTVGSGHTATVTTTATFPSVVFSCWSGGSAIDAGSDKGATGALVSTIAPGTFTPSEANTLVVTSAVDISATGNPTSVTGGFTVLAHAATQGGAAVSIGFAYLIQGSAAAENPAWTVNSSSTGVAANSAVFKAAASSSAVANPSVFAIAVN